MSTSPLSLFGVVLTAVLALSHCRRLGVPASAETCMVKLADASPVILPSGQSVSIDARTVIGDERQLLILGTPAILWSRVIDRVLSHRQLFGVIRDSSGAFSPVEMPTPNARYPTAVADGKNAWHVVFVQLGDVNKQPDKILIDSASLWYARLDGHTWSEPQQLTQVRNAAIHPAFTGKLAKLGDDLHFAYAFERPFTGPGSGAIRGGVVMLRFRVAGKKVDRVHVDTLHTWAAPSYVHLSVTDDGQAGLVLLTQEYFANRRPWPTALFSVRYAAGWASPTMVFADSLQSIIAPTLSMDSNGLFVTAKRTLNGMGVGELLAISSPGKAFRATAHVIGSIPMFDGYVGLALAPSRIVWLMPDSPTGARLRVLLGNGETAARIGTVQVRSQGATPLAVRTSDSTFILITGALARDSDDPPAFSLVSRVELHCTP